MDMHRRSLLAGASATAIATPFSRARAQGQTIRIGVLTDMSGPYRDSTGPASLLMTQVAAEEMANRGFTIEVIGADHQNKPDVGANIARQWFDQGMDAIVDVPTSSVAFAVNQIAKEKNKVFLNSGAASSDLTGSQCSPNTVHWTYDTYMLAKGTGGAIVRNGGDTWYFVTADYAFGHSLEKDAADVVKAQGGKILGTVRHPTGTSDFSSFLLQAQASKAKIVALANAVGDTVNSVKQASEFGLQAGGQELAALLMQVTDVNAIGLNGAKGLYLTEGFYWDTNDGTRKFADRFAAQMNGKRPTANQAGVYAGTLHYLRAAAAANSNDAQAVVAKMKELPSRDPLFGEGKVRADGRHIHNMYLFQVKTPAESKAPWDFYKLVETIPAAEAFRPMAEGNCPMVAKQ